VKCLKLIRQLSTSDPQPIRNKNIPLKRYGEVQIEPEVNTEHERLQSIRPKLMAPDRGLFPQDQELGPARSWPAVARLLPVLSNSAAGGWTVEKRARNGKPWCTGCKLSNSLPTSTCADQADSGSYLRSASRASSKTRSSRPQPFAAGRRDLPSSPRVAEISRRRRGQQVSSSPRPRPVLSAWPDDPARWRKRGERCDAVGDGGGQEEDERKGNLGI
jgi:hypothetical protein